MLSLHVLHPLGYLFIWKNWFYFVLVFKSTTILDETLHMHDSNAAAACSQATVYDWSKLLPLS